MADADLPTPFLCPHVPHTPGRCYRRDGPTIATVFNPIPDQPALHLRTCVECGLATDEIDKIVAALSE